MLLSNNRDFTSLSLNSMGNNTSGREQPDGQDAPHSLSEARLKQKFQVLWLHE